MNKKEEKLNYLMNKISLALKDGNLQQGFEIICKKLAELEKENAELKAFCKKLIKTNNELRESLRKYEIVPDVAYLSDGTEVYKENVGSNPYSIKSIGVSRMSHLDYLIRQDVEHGTFSSRNIFNEEYLTPQFYIYAKQLEEQIEKMQKDQKTAFIKGMRHFANAMKDYDREEGAWTDYFEHAVDEVLKRELKK